MTYILVPLALLVLITLYIELRYWQATVSLLKDILWLISRIIKKFS